MTHAESWILSYLVNSLWQLPLLFAAGWVAARALRRIGPAAEHRAWVSTLVLQALLPAIPTLPGDWLRAILSSLIHPAHPAPAGDVSIVFGPGAALGGFHLPGALLAIAAASYIAVTLFFAVRLLWRFLRLSVIRRNSRELTLSPAQAERFAHARQTAGLAPVSLRVTSHLHVPVTLGLVRNVILLPDDFAPALTGPDFRTVIEHELAHIRRRDFALNILYELLSLPIAYHPLLRLTRERIAETREMICDQLAARHAGALEYGRSLLRLASLLLNVPPARNLYAIGIFDSHTLERRLMRLKHIPATTPGARRALVIAACALFALATCASALTLHVNVLAPFPAAIAADSAPSHPPVIPAGKAAGHVLNKVVPVYPPEAKKAHIQGTVTLKATISKDGDIEYLSVLSGPKELQQSALDAVRQWTYKPFLLNGEPTEVQTTINVIYSLTK